MFQFLHAQVSNVALQWSASDKVPLTLGSVQENQCTQSASFPAECPEAPQDRGQQANTPSTNDDDLEDLHLAEEDDPAYESFLSDGEDTGLTIKANCSSASSSRGRGDSRCSDNSALSARGVRGRVAKFVRDRSVSFSFALTSSSAASDEADGLEHQAEVANACLNAMKSKLSRRHSMPPVHCASGCCIALRRPSSRVVQRDVTVEAADVNLRGVFARSLYNPVMARTAHGVLVEDMVLGVRLASLAYSDDEPGTIDQLDGGKEAVEMIVGDKAKARLPLTRILQRMGYTVDRIFSCTRLLGDIQAIDVQGYIARNESDIVLAYRGTNSMVDWLTNFGASTVPFHPLRDKSLGHAPLVDWSSDSSRRPRVHRGFYDAMLASTDILDEVLLPQLRDSRPKRLVVCGHSLGGAVAQGALAYLLLRFDWANSPHKLLFVSAGQPRLGDARFKAWLEKRVAALNDIDKCRTARLVNDHDGVPRVPPGRCGFRHALTNCLVTRAGDLFVNPEARENKTVVNDLKKKLKLYVEDHRPALYLTRLGMTVQKERCSFQTAAAGRKRSSTSSTRSDSLS